MTRFTGFVPTLLLVLTISAAASAVASHGPATAPPPGYNCVGGYNPSSITNVCTRTTAGLPSASQGNPRDFGCYYVVGNLPGCVVVHGQKVEWPGQPAVWFQNSGMCNDPTTHTACINGDSTFLVAYAFSWLA